MCILELNKVFMYNFHYDYIKNKYGNKSKLLFTDTDSLMYEIKTADVYEDFNSNKEIFDFINYSTKSKYYDDSNKLVKHFCQACCFNFQCNQNFFFVKNIVLIFCLIKTAFLSIYKNIVRLLAWYSKFKIRKTQKKDKWRINANSVAP